MGESPARSVGRTKYNVRKVVSIPPYLRRRKWLFGIILQEVRKAALTDVAPFLRDLVEPGDYCQAWRPDGVRSSYLWKKTISSNLFGAVGGW